jgi:glycosyltransferase involved in cell wall biosynthesis
LTRTVRLLTTAPLHWSAGHDVLLLALRSLIDAGQDLTLRIEGSGPARDRVLFTIADLGLADVARLAEAATDGGYDALVLAAVDDRPWPGVLAACSRARRIVASDLAWIRANIPGPEVRLVPPGDPERLADALLEL